MAAGGKGRGGMWLLSDEEKKASVFDFRGHCVAAGCSLCIQSTPTEYISEQQNMQEKMLMCSLHVFSPLVYFFISIFKGIFASPGLFLSSGIRTVKMLKFFCLLYFLFIFLAL